MASKSPLDDVVDVKSIFGTGFLAEVYNQRPIGSEDVDAVVTRFPPEPNGYMHLGHCKALAINFGFAEYHGGSCYLRLDDTNPKAERHEFASAMVDMVHWLGFKPRAVTYTSDKFEQLYDLAQDLIRADGAYVCHCTKAEINAARGGGKEGKGAARYACAHRSRPVEESLAEFQAMQAGKYSAGEAALRLKQDITNPNPQMWDLAAYRIPETDAPHYRTGSKWKIYPTYDFAHCLCDSFEHITHSLCTTEFELSRVSYDWLVEKLGVYRPMQREYGRLSLEGVVLSKRKLEALVNSKTVHGWDDPRLYTLVALKRRGVPPGAILKFVTNLGGVTKANTSIQISRFEQTVRGYLETSVPRLMLVLDPIKVIIDDLPEDHHELVELPFGRDPSFGVHKVGFTRTVYIDRTDFREVDSKDYFRLAPGKAVGLMKVPYPIKATSFEKDPDTNLVTVIHASYQRPGEDGKFKKPKTYIHWVSDGAAAVSVRFFNSLFQPKTIDNPDPVFNEESQIIYPNALIESGLDEIRSRAPWPAEPSQEIANGAGETGSAPETVRFQGMRVGYFCIDKDQRDSDGKILLNRIVSLKEDTGKSS